MEQDRVLVDWLTVVISIPANQSDKDPWESEHHKILPLQKRAISASQVAKQLLAILQLDGTETNFDYWKLSGSAFPYDVAYVRDGFKLFFTCDNDSPTTRQKMGIRLDCQGRGCRYISAALARQGKTWQDLFKDLAFVFGEYLHVTRIDVARDYTKKDYHLTPQSLYKRLEHTRCVNAGLKKGLPQVLTKKENFSFTQSAKVSGENTGSTLYVGKPGNQLLLRVYDKLAERVYHHGDTWLKKNLKFWVRYEFECHGEIAEKCVSALASGMTGGDVWVSCMARTMTILPTKLEFDRKKTTQIEVKKKKKTELVSVPTWWADFVGEGVDQLGLTVSARERPDLYSDKWLETTVAHTIFGRLITEKMLGGDPAGLLRHWLEQGSKQLSQKDIDNIKTVCQGLYQGSGKPSTKFAKDWTDNAEKIFGKKLRDRFAQEKTYDTAKDFDRYQKGFSYPGTFKHFLQWVDKDN